MSTTTPVWSGSTLLATLSPGWYAVETSTGKVGLVLHHQFGAIDLGAASNGTVTQAEYLGGTSLTMPQLLSNVGPKVQSALVALGATAKEMTAFITQADVGAGKQQTGSSILGDLTLGFAGTGAGKQTTQMLFTPSGSVTASSGTTPVSTTPSGDTQTTGPSLSNPLDILSTVWTWLTTAKNWLKPLEVIAGAVAIYLAIKSLTGIQTPKISITKAAAAVAA